MVKKKLKLLFAADIHGNTDQYNKILNKGISGCYDALILGGDLCPKGIYGGSMQEQHDFLKEFLLPRLEEYSALRYSPKVYLMLGNDDWAGNRAYLEKNEGRAYKLMDKDIIHLTEDYYLIGYPYVPLTPFKMKDWEKWDLASNNDIEFEREILLEGISSWLGHYEGKSFSPENRHESIENDMKILFKNINPEKTIFVSHAPPFNTNLDILYSREHIGSIAIRMAIEKHEPLLTLHGHIHETVDISCEFIDKIKKTICASVGNHNLKNNPSVLSIVLPDMEIRRITVE